LALNIHTGTCLRLFTNGDILIIVSCCNSYDKKKLFCKQICQCRQFFNRKPIDNISLCHSVYWCFFYLDWHFEALNGPEKKDKILKQPHSLFIVKFEIHDHQIISFFWSVSEVSWCKTKTVIAVSWLIWWNKWFQSNKKWFINKKKLKFVTIQ